MSEVISLLQMRLPTVSREVILGIPELAMSEPSIQHSTDSLRTGLQEMDKTSTAGGTMHKLMAELYPICRSITGEGVRETLRILQRLIPLEIHEVPTGTPVFDWTVPKEWNIRDAYILDGQGKRVVDFQKSNLHVISYSQPVRKKISLDELRKHLVSLPEHPDWIPYRTSYYNENWGFCLSHRQLEAMHDDEYEVASTRH